METLTYECRFQNAKYNVHTDEFIFISLFYPLTHFLLFSDLLK